MNTELPTAMLNKLQNKAASSLLHLLALEGGMGVDVSAFESFATVVKSASTSHYS
jgi:phosphoketolase